MSNDWIRDAVNAMDAQQGTGDAPVFNTKRTYEVRDYSTRDDADGDFDVVASKLTWEQARDHVDKNTTPVNAGELVIHAEDPPPFYIVTVVLWDRAYGGPEEGGWWYDTYDPFHHDAKWYTHEAGGPWLFTSRTEATNKARWLNKLLEDQVNKGRHSPISVLSQGHFQAFVHENVIAAEPQERPIYE